MNNQLLMLNRAYRLAKLLNRTLLINPLFNAHITGAELEFFKQINEFDYIRTIKFNGEWLSEHTEYHIKKYFKFTGDIPNFGYNFLEDISPDDMFYQQQFQCLKFPCIAKEFKKNFTIFKEEYAPHFLQQYLCIDNDFCVKSYDTDGEIDFATEIKDISNSIIRNIFGEEKYIGVHVRRSDFKKWCKEKWDPKNEKHCYLSYPEMFKIVNNLKTKHGIKKVYVSTNEEEEINKKLIKEQGWRQITPNYPDVNDFTQVIIDMYICSRADVFVGNRFSSFTSRIIAFREKIHLKSQYW